MFTQELHTSSFDTKLTNLQSTVIAGFLWCRRGELNTRPTDYESVALPLSYAGITSEGGGTIGWVRTICNIRWRKGIWRHDHSQLLLFLTRIEPECL